ncbi:MAG: hypothetical protein HYV45_03025 [Candidatus Moranbacteria bacterium]|nr:hypothetical protein [Candidatus Moranbacteria bacterium]
MQKFLYVVEHFTCEIKKDDLLVSFLMTEGKPIVIAGGVVLKVEALLRK